MEPAKTAVEPEPGGVAPSAVQRAASAEEIWAAIELLPCTLSVELRIAGTTIGDIADLEPGTVMRSGHPSDEPIPLWVNGVQIGHGELDIVRERVAVRITEVE